MSGNGEPLWRCLVISVKAKYTHTIYSNNSTKGFCEVEDKTFGSKTKWKTWKVLKYPWTV